MSHENVSGQPPADSRSVKKRRSPFERILVWGGILALLAVLLVELRAQQGYNQSLNAAQSAMGENPEDLGLADFEALLKFSPQRSGPEPTAVGNSYTYSWFSIFRTGQFKIIVETTREAEDEPEIVLGLSTANPDDPEDAVADGEAGQAGGPPSPGSMAPGGTGGMGGGPPVHDATPPNPVEEGLDADGDGELSEGEINEASAALQALDRNGDGELTEDEYSAGNLSPSPVELPEIMRIPDTPSSGSEPADEPQDNTEDNAQDDPQDEAQAAAQNAESSDD